MEEQKNLQDKELAKVNGGQIYDEMKIDCVNCKKEFDASCAADRTTGSGCDKTTEFKCPHCGAWQEFH